MPQSAEADTRGLRVELTDGRAELGSPRLWEEKTTIRAAPRLLPQPGPPALQAAGPPPGG